MSASKRFQGSFAYPRGVSAMTLSAISAMKIHVNATFADLRKEVRSPGSP